MLLDALRHLNASPAPPTPTVQLLSVDRRGQVETRPGAGKSKHNRLKRAAYAYRDLPLQRQARRPHRSDHSRSSRATAPAPTSGAPRVRVFDAAVEKAYGGKRKIAWQEVLAGEKAFNKTGNWLPDETVDAFRKYLVGIKGPLTTPIGGGIRSLNVALRQMLDLYVCLRPVRYFKGVPSPGEAPRATSTW